MNWDSCLNAEQRTRRATSSIARCGEASLSKTGMTLGEVGVCSHGEELFVELYLWVKCRLFLTSLDEGVDFALVTFCQVSVH